MKTYKIWIEIEEFDDETGEHTPGEDIGLEPDKWGEMRTIEEALAVQGELVAADCGMAIQSRMHDRGVEA